MAKRLGWYLPEQLILKITLVRSDPKIWRRIEVHSGWTLDDLHYIVQAVFDWDNSHLYQFFVTPGGKLTGAAMQQAKRYHMQPPDPSFGDEGDTYRPADEVTIGRVFTPECKQIVYEYDFGDSWMHLVKLEKRTPGGDMGGLPRCLAGENAPPGDDKGGIYGYYEWLSALQDPQSKMHGQAVEWLGKDFDPARFDLDEVNQRLARAFVPVPKRSGKRRREE